MSVNWGRIVWMPLVAVFPLVSLMKHQVSYLRITGISSISLSDLEEGEPEKVVKGVYLVVFGTPESWL